MAKSTIEWTGETWNYLTGCNKKSAGCKFCYAEALSKSLKRMGKTKYMNEFRITMHPDELKKPYAWKGNKLVFVNSMSDSFHEEVPLSFIHDAFKVMNDTSQHTYQLLTKRSERLKELSNQLKWGDNIWMGVSVEDDRFRHRIDNLMATEAKIKFLSIEPLIGPLPNLDLSGIDWVIVGGESGPNARPIKKEWVESIQQNCLEQGVPFFFKQWGKAKFNPDPADMTVNKQHPLYAKGGCRLNGKVYREMPVAFKNLSHP